MIWLYIAWVSPRSQASRKLRAAGANGPEATTAPATKASVATTTIGTARVSMRRRRSAAEPPALKFPKFLR